MHQLKISQRITPRDTRSVAQYFQEVNREPLLTLDEEIELAQRIHKGDKQALERMVKSNLRFVISVANQYAGSGLEQMDIINEGNIGLIKAAERFDETRGFKFISYAVWWVRQSILSAIAEQGRMVRLPLNKLGEQHRIYQFIAEYEQKHECRPNMDEIAEATGIDPTRVSNLLGVSGKHASLDAPLMEDGDGSLVDILPADDDSGEKDLLTKESLQTEMEQVLSHLSARESSILKSSFGLFGARVLSLDELGLEYGLSRERVRQIKDKAIRKIRAIPASSRLRIFL